MWRPRDEWPAERVERLRVLWADRRRNTASTIARDLGVSVNAVVGKRRRLDLPTRGSPIKRGPPTDRRGAMK
jgi:hypothetical protein